MRFVLPFTVILGLAGCGSAADKGGNTAAAPASVASTNASAAAPAPAPASAKPLLSRDFLVGAWSSDGDCAAPDVRLGADGATEGGRWRLEGKNLIRTTSDGEEESLTVEALAQDRMAVSFMDLPPREFTRCPA